MRTISIPTSKLKLCKEHLQRRILGKNTTGLSLTEQAIKEDRVIDFSPSEKFFRLQIDGWVDRDHYELLEVLDQGPL